MQRSIHPLAGFGANIGLEDVRSLLEVVSEKGLDDESAIRRYSIRRRIRSDYVIYLLEVFCELIQLLVPASVGCGTLQLIF